VEVMAGIALASKAQKQDVVAVALIDERALATGDLHEGLNFAAVHELPLVVMIEKRPADPASAASAAPAGGDHYQRLKSYGAPTVTVDGNDVLQVLQVVDTAVDRARAGRGPTVIEARTDGRTRFSMREDIVSVWPESASRFLGPGAGAAGEASRTQQKLALEDDALNDPVEQFEAFLIEHAQLRPEEQEEILIRVSRVVAEDVQRAERERPSDDASLTSGVFGPPTGQPADRTR